MAQNEGPFSKGERLTAVKLNDLAVGRPMTVAGNGFVNRSGGRDAIEIHNPEVMYIRLTEKDTSKTPIRYGWKEVDRLGNPTSTVSATWGNMTDRKAKMTDDYAIELNNQNLSVTDNYIYRAERSPATGEWLFFLRKRSSSGGGVPCVGGLCEKIPTTVQFDVGPQGSGYTGPPGPVYKQFNYETYQKNIVTGAVCLLSRRTVTDDFFFSRKAGSLHPHDINVSISFLKSEGGGLVEIDDVTATLAPYVYYRGGSSWFRSPIPGEACPRLTQEYHTEIVTFTAKTYAAVSVSSASCEQRVFLSKGVRVQCKIKTVQVDYDYRTNPVTGALEVVATSSETYLDVGPYMCDNASPIYSTTATASPRYGSTIDILNSSTSCGGTFVINNWGRTDFSNFE